MRQSAVEGTLSPPLRTIDGVDPAKRFVADFAEQVDRLNALADQVGSLLGEAKKQAAREITPVIIGEVSRSIDRLVLQRYRWLVLGAVLVILAALGAGVALDRWVLPSSAPVAIQCAPHQPGQIYSCTMQMRGG